MRFLSGGAVALLPHSIEMTFLFNRHFDCKGLRSIHHERHFDCKGLRSSGTLREKSHAMETHPMNALIQVMQTGRMRFLIVRFVATQPLLFEMTVLF